MPQISQLAATYLSQAFWLLLTFGIVFFVIGRGMLPKVQSTIEGRDQRIADDLAAAKRARDEADAAEESWRQRDLANREKAQSIVADARARAAKSSEDTLRAANEQQSAEVAAREGDIRAASARAVGEIQTLAAEAAQDIVAHVSGTNVSIEDAQSVVKVVMAHG